MGECPESTVLKSFERGELSESAAHPIQLHSENCGTCLSRLEEIRRHDLEARFLRDACSDLSRSQHDASATDVPGEPTRQSLLENGGWRISDYERVQLCGEGAYGSVWAVKDRVGVFRALKALDVARLKRAHVGCRESTALETYCNLVGRHPYLISVFHVGVVGDLLYYTMELADNENTKEPVGSTFPENYSPLTLKTVIRRRRIQPDTAMEIMRRLLRGLNKLHSLDLIHRDIKPANIVFVKLRPKLADIGMITPTEESRVVIGTPRYMPPDRTMDQTADTFAMGKVLYEMIAGDEFDTFPHLPPAIYDKSVRWDLRKVDELLQRACSYHAKDRFESAAAMLEDLEACAELPMGDLFSEADKQGGPTGVEITPREKTQLLVAILKVVPWLAGLAALAMILKFIERLL